MSAIATETRLSVDAVLCRPTETLAMTASMVAQDVGGSEAPSTAALLEQAQSQLTPKRLCLGVKSDEAVTLRFEALVAVPRDGHDPAETVLVPCPITMTVSPTELKSNRLRLVFEAPRCVEIQRPRKSA